MLKKARREKNFQKEFGIYLKQKRERLGLSQSEVAHELGYSSPQFVSNFERGLCSLPLNKIKKLIDLYELKGEEVVELMLSLHETYLREELNVKKRAKLKKHA